jgi:F-type H+-transporting ATPase subunit delta
MKMTKQLRRDAKHLLNTCRVDGLLDENRVRQAVTKVLELKPRGYVGILSHFQRLIKLDIDRRTAKVESATPLAAELRERVQQSLTATHGKGLKITFGENPALLGGMRIKVGSDVYDGSVQARLAELQDSF